jgi:hypothetical protein
LAEIIVVTPGGQANLPVPQEQVPALAAQEADPSAVVTTPGQAAPLVPRASEAETVPKPAAGQPSAVTTGIGARGASPQARLALPRSGSVSEDTSVSVFSLCALNLLSLSFSKRRQGLAGLAPTKALKTKLTSAAGAVVRHAGCLASAQGSLQRGAQAARVAMGQASPADPPVGAAIIPGEAADAAAALSPPDLLPALTPVGAVADSPAKPPVAVDVGMVEAPLPVVIPDLPVLGHEERAAVVAKVGDWRPATLAEERPSTSTAVVPDASTAGGPDASVEGARNRGPSWGAAALSPHSSTPMSGVGSRSYSGAAPPQTRKPSSPSTMSWRRGLGIISVSIPRRR